MRGALTVAALALVVAACGGQASSSPPTAARTCVDQANGAPADVLLCAATAHVATATQVRMSKCLESRTGAPDVIACMREAVSAAPRG
jgi:hypothetical protein